MAASMMEDDVEYKFEWGKKRGMGGKKRDVQFYESFTLEGVQFTLNDAVCLQNESSDVPHIGKLIKIWENRDKSRKIKVQWFFRRSDILTYLEGIQTKQNELFLACGDGKGFANVNPFEAIVGKCNVVYMSKSTVDSQPSEEAKAGFVCYRFFDVVQRKVVDEIDNKTVGTEGISSSSSSTSIESIRLGRSYTKPHSQRHRDGTKQVWQMLWRKIKRDKQKKGFGIYDPESYSMNFDHGTAWMEPDNLPRSFSSRYADPSRILPPTHLLD
ncbi:unnamed protein product [Sphenostylis stenocarpa]|uniref:BAH domain-containing protein n=1 Tax=Sphenostylis stenocarpa TaxID=92480 RepID=A0AA86SWP2_9FABA|nr:unnamed protein product [Sphenostylis stenocarpa]